MGGQLFGIDLHFFKFVDAHCATLQDRFAFSRFVDACYVMLQDDLHFFNR